MRNLRSEQEIMTNWKGDPSQPVVSICCITYNHEPYIEDALEGFLIQETDFPFEILIHDDASTDKAADIIREYEAAYPILIKPIYQTENQYSKGKKPNPEFNFPRAKGVYIALCEGDDYWTDPKKLQMQVDFLEANKEFSMCCHAVKTVYDENWNLPKNNRFNTPIKVATFEDIIDNHFIPTNSLIFRNGLITKWPRGLLSTSITSGDIPLALMLSYHGKLYYIYDVMAVKRINSGGVTADKNRRYKARYFKYELYYHVNRYTNKRYKKILRKKILRKLPSVIKTSLREKEFYTTIKHISYALKSIY